MLADVVGGQDLAAGRFGHNPRRDVHGLPEQLAVPLGDLADVDPDADLDPAPRVGHVVLLERALDTGAALTAATVDRKEKRNPSPRTCGHGHRER